MIDYDPQIASNMRALITGKLSEIEETRNVRILFAIESGSRAWGFPSPDSDYDVRFVYADDPDWYLSLTPGRDVIELPIEGDLDINGWDIRKALFLLLKPNPVLLEWLSSPIRYMWNEAITRRLIDFADTFVRGEACLHHYLNLGRRQWSSYIESKTEVNLKKYFYVVRPALAIRHIRMNPDLAPPMNFQALLMGTALAPELIEDLSSLLRMKSQAKELGLGARMPLVDALIEEEFKWADEHKTRKMAGHLAHRAEADTIFREIVKPEQWQNTTP